MEDINDKLQETEQVSGDKMTLLSWPAPSRIFKKRDRSFFQTVIALVFLIGIILFLLKEFLLIGVVLAFAFVGYVLATVPPENINHKITVNGFEIAGIMSHWNELTEFWFEEKDGYKILVLQKKIGFPSRVMALLGNQDQGQVKEKINRYLSFREAPEKTMTDKVADWLHRRLPFEKR